jgi:Domain of unknown function (DUF3885)
VERTSSRAGVAPAEVQRLSRRTITPTIERRVTLGEMPSPHQLDLAAYLRKTFPSLTLGGGLLYRWPVGIRFELGPESFRERAPKLYEAVFAPEDVCVIISQNWPENASPPARQRYFRVFSLPGIFDPKHPISLQSLEITREEEGEQETFILQWGQLPARSFRYGSVLEGIANADHAQTPSVEGRVYFLNPATAIIAHIYDDRGLDIIAATRDSLMPIYRTFNDWISACTIAGRVQDR